MLRLKLFISALILTTTTVIAQRGSLGNLSIGAQDTWVNTYTDLTSDANAGDLQLNVSDNSMSDAFFSVDLAAGDLILIIQMQGATMDINTITAEPTSSGGWGGTHTVQNSWIAGTNPEWDPSEYGQVTNYNNAGNFEYVEVSAVSGGNIIELNCGLTKNYTAAGHVQVVRIPRFEDLTVPNNTSITAPAWNGSTGGIVAVEVNGDLTITGTGTISANDIGFRGGVPDNTTSQNCNVGSQGFLGSYDMSEGAEKGEGIGGFYTEYDNLYSRYCYGAVANGGGGANFHNAGGGGGSNVGVGTFYGYGVPDPTYTGAWNLEDATMVGNPSSGGGRGGYSHAETNNDPLSVGPNNNAWNGDCRRTTGGTGGHALTYDSERIFMGGGGGAGDDNNTYGGQGGRGGGIVMLQVYGNITGTGSIAANGEDGEDSSGPSPGWGAKTGDDGSGGAGGGGAIRISNANPIPSGIDLIAIGGEGGSQNLQLGNFATPQADGPGGGGGGGLIAYTSGTPMENVSGGISGTTNSSFVTNFPQNGATGGANGMSGQSTVIYDIVAENDTVCGGGSTTLTATVTGTLPSGGTIEWYDAQYGGTNVNSGANFTTPNLAVTTTYYVGVCPGTFRIPVEVAVSPAIVISGTPPTISPETCAGNDGSITGLTASGGSGTLTFDWSGTTTPSENLTNAVGGNYTLTVTDENGCTETSGPYTISPSPGPSIDLSLLNVQDETCLGDDGEITGIVATGTNLTYEWNATETLSEDTIGLNAGTYTLVVTDDASCTATAGPFTVNTSPGPSIDDSNISIVDETCLGDDGEITGIVATGTNLTYEWNGNETLSEDTVGVAAGNYTLVVTDDLGCTATSGPYTVNATTGPTVDVSNIAISDEACNQGNGSITGISASGNNLTYEWNSTETLSEDTVGVSAGSYTLEVIDDLGCSVIVGPYTVQNISGPVIDISNMVINDVTCSGNDGSITDITASGGFGVLTFDWNGTTTPSEDLLNVAGGNYTLTVTDENGCTATSGPHTVSPTTGPSIDLSGLTIQDESCLGNDGSIEGIVASGSNIVIEWNGTETLSEDTVGLNAGTYTLVVTDDANCTSSAGPFTVNTSPGPSIDDSNISIVDETCLGDDGEITGIVATGTNLTYEWNGSETLSEDTVGVAAGNYTLVVTDDLGCTATSGPYTVNATSGPTVDDSNIAISDEGCNQVNGSITGITASGNNLTYEWNGTETLSEDTVGLSAGSYTLEVIDDLGCSVTAGPYTVQNIPGPVIDISNIVISDVTCIGNNGSITGITSTGNNLTYEWNSNNTPTIELTGVSAGSYGLQVTDENGCTDVAGPFIIDSLPSPTIDDNNLTVSQGSCAGNDGSISGLQVTGNGLTFEWNGQTTPTADLPNIPSGDYTLIVTDANGCTVSYGPVNVGGSIIPNVNATPAISTIELGESVDLNANVSPTGNTVSWSPSTGLTCINCENPTASPEQSGWYVVTVTSADGCSTSDSLFIEVEDPCGETMIPTVFSPNEDGLNDELCVLGGCIQTMNLQIFNRWGEKVFESNEETDCWDGTYNGQKVNTGTFIYKLNGTRTDGSEFNSAGNLNVIR